MATKRSALEALERCLDSALCQALAEPARVKILRILLLHGPLDINGVSGHLDLDRSVVSRHLKLLREVDLVSCERTGRNRVYAVKGIDAVRRLEAMGQALMMAMQVCCPEKLEAASCCGVGPTSPGTTKKKS